MKNERIEAAGAPRPLTYAQLGRMFPGVGLEALRHLLLFLKDAGVVQHKQINKGSAGSGLRGVWMWHVPREVRIDLSPAGTQEEGKGAADEAA